MKVVFHMVSGTKITLEEKTAQNFKKFINENSLPGDVLSVRDDDGELTDIVVVKNIEHIQFIK